MDNKITIDNVRYFLKDDGTWSVKEFECYQEDTTLEIPAEIKGIPVTEIGDLAFINGAVIEKLIVGDNVTRIGYNAFMNCKGIRAVYLGGGVKSIGEGAFEWCCRLHTLVLGAGVETIEKEAFKNCYCLYEIYNLSSLSLEKGSLSYGEIAKYARRIERDFSKKSWFIRTKDGYKIFMDKTPVLFSAKRGTNRILIPNGIKEIAPYAFFERQDVYSVTMPESVLKVGRCAFNECSNLERVIFSKNLEDIGAFAFEECTELSKIILPRSLKSMGRYAFSGCYSIENITIPEGVTTVGQGVFHKCYGLKNIIFHDNVKVLCEFAFYGTGLSNVLLPKNLKVIGNSCFADTSLSHITLPDSLTSIGENLFDGCKMEYNESESICYLGNENNPYMVAMDLTDQYDCEISFNPDCKLISSGVFGGCEDNIVGIALYEKVTFVGRGAFNGASRLVELLNYSKLDFSPASKLYKLNNLNLIHYSTDIDEPTWIKEDDENGIGYIDDGERKVLLYEYNDQSHVVIPDYITDVVDCAFLWEDTVESVVIPTSVKRIGKCAFNNCANLKKVTINGALEKVGFNAFYGCKQLEYTSLSEARTLDGNKLILDDETTKIYYLGNDLCPKLLGIVAVPHHYELDNLIKEEGCTCLALSDIPYDPYDDDEDDFF